jgi:hypothetical protein
VMSSKNTCAEVRQRCQHQRARTVSNKHCALGASLVLMSQLHVLDAAVLLTSILAAMRNSQTTAPVHLGGRLSHIDQCTSSNKLFKLAVLPRFHRSCGAHMLGSIH